MGESGLQPTSSFRHVTLDLNLYYASTPLPQPPQGPEAGPGASFPSVPAQNPAPPRDSTYRTNSESPRLPVCLSELSLKAIPRCHTVFPSSPEKHKRSARRSHSVPSVVEIAGGSRDLPPIVSLHPITRLVSMRSVLSRTGQQSFPKLTSTAHTLSGNSDLKDRAISELWDLSTFRSTLSHDLRTPLSTALAAVELLLSPKAGKLSAAESRDLLQKTWHALQSAALGVDNVLDINAHYDQGIRPIRRRVNIRRFCFGPLCCLYSNCLLEF